ncbi:MAG: PAS domain-containing protein [Clostridiales bacterium]|nr:PAS domain-containing protein [Clostridiales bacterium]
MKEITIYGHDCAVLRSVLKRLRKTYQIVDSIDQIGTTKWLLVDEKQLLLESNELIGLGQNIIVICKSATQRKIKQFFEMGIKDYVLAPIIEDELIKKMGYYENEEDRRELDQRLSLATEVASIGTWDYDILSDDLIWDNNMFKIHHISIDTTIYQLDHWLAMVHPDDRHLVDDAIENVLEKHENLDLTYRILTNGVEYFIRTTAVLLIKDNEPIRLTGSCIDATDRTLIEREKVHYELKYHKKNKEFKEIYKSLNLTQERMEATLKSADVGYWEWDVVNDESYESDQWFSMLGYDKNTFEFNDEWFYGLMHEMDLTFMIEKLNRIAKGIDHNINKEFRLKNNYGDWTWILARGEILEYLEDGTAKTVSGVHININQLKESEKQLDLLSKAVDTSPVGIIIADAEGLIDYVNPAFEQMTGYSLEETIGRSTSIIKSEYHDDEFYKTLWDTISSGETWKGVFYNKKKSGEYYWESGIISPMFDEFKNIVSYIGVKEDITIDKERENEMILRNKRLTRQQWILQSLTQNTELTSNDLSISLKVILESVVSGLETSGCAICFFDEMNTLLRCRHHYVVSDDIPENNDVLRLSDYRDYFDAILSGSQIIMSSIEHSDYKKMYDFYIKKNIFSSLHVPIWFRGEVIGVVKAEQALVYRKWVPDEISFLRAISDLLTITLETRERLKAQKEAEDATKAKSDFLANMSHEIRTPMNAVIGLTHLALKTEMTVKQKDYLVKINEAAKHLLVLINDILDVSKVEAGKMVLEKVPFSLDSITTQIKSMMMDKANEKGLELSVEVANTVPSYLKGDPYRLGQVLINLVGNAIKFTSKGFVKVFIDRVYSDTNNEDYFMLQFSVKDTGIGITEVAKEKLFDSFEQADTSITRQFGGTGLGLTICKQLVELFEGEIWVESTYEEGSEFIFTANFEASMDIVESEMLNITATDIDPGNHNKILIAEDNEINQQIITEFLEPYGIESVCVENGQLAVDYLESGEPCSLILMDIQMPVLDGFETTKYIRRYKIYDHIPIIAISADARLDAKKRTMNCGMNDFITKPIDQKEMVETILKWLGQKPFNLHIENINTGLGLLRCNGNETLYLNILSKFVKDHKNDLELVKEYILKKTGDEKKVLHTLKGLLGHIGAEWLYEEIQILETDVSERKRGYKKKLESFSKGYENIVEAIEEALLKFDDVVVEKEVNDRAFKELLKTLLPPLKNGYINQIKNIMNQLNSFQPKHSIAKTYEMMCRQIKRYQYDIAEENLEILIKELEVKVE